MSKPREFWVLVTDNDSPVGSAKGPWFPKPESDGCETVHVIEKSAADKLAEALSNHDCKRPRGLSPSEWRCNKCQALKEYRGEK